MKYCITLHIILLHTEYIYTHLQTLSSNCDYLVLLFLYHTEMEHV